MGQQPTKMKVVQAAPNKVVLQNPVNQAQTTIDPTKLGPAGVQQGPQGVTINTAANPTIQPQAPQLKPGEEVDVLGTEVDAPSQPGSPLTPNPPGQQDQAAAEDMGDTEVNDMKKLAGIREQPTAPAPTSQIPTSLTVAGMLDDPEVDPAMKPQLQQMIVAKPDGTVDLAQTMRKASGEFYRAIPELIEVFQSLAQQAAAFVKSPEFSELGPQDQNSIINLAKTLPGSLQQMQAQITKGAQAHDAGFNKLDAATGQYGDGTVEDAQVEVPMDDSYYPTGYNDKNRERAMMRKAFQSITQDKHYFEGSDVIALAKRVANIETKAKTNNTRDIVDLKKLAGL